MQIMPCIGHYLLCLKEIAIFYRYIEVIDNARKKL